MRYTLMVLAAQKPMVEAIISKLPSHYVKAWQTVGKGGTTYHSEPTEGTTQVQLPVGQLATLTAVPIEGDTERKLPPTHYILSGEFNDAQLKALKDAMVATRLVKATTWWDGGEPKAVWAVVNAMRVE